MGVTDRDDVRRLLDSLNGAGYSLLVADPADTIRNMCEELIEGDADYVTLKEDYDAIEGTGDLAIKAARETWNKINGTPPDINGAQKLLTDLIDELT